MKKKINVHKHRKFDMHAPSMGFEKLRSFQGGTQKRVAQTEGSWWNGTKRCPIEQPFGMNFRFAVFFSFYCCWRPSCGILICWMRFLACSSRPSLPTSSLPALCPHSLFPLSSQCVLLIFPFFAAQLWFFSFAHRMNYILLMSTINHSANLWFQLFKWH